MKVIQFRPLNQNETHLLRKMLADGDAGTWRAALAAGLIADQLRVAYRYQAHRESVEYTVALVLLPSGSMLVGTTKRNPCDPPNPIRGQIEALRRAFASDVAFALPEAPSP